MGKTEDDMKAVNAWLNKTVPECRRCPLCWGGYKGWGNQYARNGMVVYYRCEMCNHTWKDRIPTEAIIKDAHSKNFKIPPRIHNKMVDLNLR